MIRWNRKRALIFILILGSLSLLMAYLILPLLSNPFFPPKFDFSLADNVTGFDHFIVPNVVHFVRFGNPNFTLVDLVVLKSVHLNHRPDKIVIHCDCTDLAGRYWQRAKQDIPRLEVNFTKRPTSIFGNRLSSVYHASDIARIQLLRKNGGIFLDNDVYVVKSLNPYRKFEFALGWPPDQNLGTQVLVAHKDARFLRLWLNSYHYYQPRRWYFNAGELPTQMILQKRPELVHRVLYDFGVHDLTYLLYGSRSEQWKNYHAIHLLLRHKHYLVPIDPVRNFDSKNILTYNRTFGDMARLVLCGSTTCHNFTL